MKIMMTVLVSIISLSIQAQDTDLTKIKRDIGILTSALKASLSFDDARQSDRHDEHEFFEGFRIKGTYLKHQGVLLTVEFSQHGHYLLADMGDFLVPLGELEIPEIPEITTITFMDEDDYDTGIYESMCTNTISSSWTQKEYFPHRDMVLQ